MPDSPDGSALRFHAIVMADLPAHDEWLTPPEAERLQRFRFAKRREESRLGRWTAKHAIAGVLDVPTDADTLRGLVIRNASDGAPEAFLDDEPAGVTISMTDRADWAVCTVLPGEVAIGCDLELVEPRSALFVRDWFTAAEQRWVADVDDHDLAANLVWSAKESALKVLRTGLRRDTRSVEVRFADAATTGDAWTALSVVTEEGDEFPGWWRRFGDFVLTVAAAAGTDPPEPIHAPSPLDRAVPTHTWMAAPITRSDRRTS